MAKNKYYSLGPILRVGEPLGAKYYMVYGERSNGKTYSGKELGLNGYVDKKHKIDIKGYIQDGSQLAIIRRWQDDFKGKRGATLFDDLVANGSIEKWTEGKWNNVYYYSGRWYLAKFDDKLNKMIHDETPFAYAFALSTMEHDKSTSYPKIDKIIFDEFLTRGTYLGSDEFITFMNVISTIVRDRDNVRIFMFGNTVNAYSPYFDEMQIDIKNIKQGDIIPYKYGESKLVVCVEYADTSVKSKKASDIYFAFQNNPKLSMITGGAWEMAIYPHAPCKWTPKHIKFTYFIKFGGEILQCEIIQKDDLVFTFVHKKTTPIKDDTKDLIYSPEYSPKPNYLRKLNKPLNNLQARLWSYFVKEQVYYQSNSVGEVVRNYILWCNADKLV